MKNRTKPADTHQAEPQESSLGPLQQERPADLATQAIQPGNRSVEADASLLGDQRLSPVQRQRVAARIGRLSGNQHLQRVIALTAGPQGKGDAPAVQLEEEEQAEGPAEEPATEPVEATTPVKIRGEVRLVNLIDGGCMVRVKLPYGAWEDNIIGFKVDVVEGNDGVFKSVPVTDSHYYRGGTMVKLTIGGTPFRSQIKVEVKYQATVETADEAKKRQPGSGASPGSDSGGETEQAEDQPEQEQQEQDQQDDQAQSAEPLQEVEAETGNWEESVTYNRLKERVGNRQFSSTGVGRLKMIGAIHGLQGLELLDAKAQDLIGNPDLKNPITRQRREMAACADTVYKAKPGQLPSSHHKLP